MTITPQVEAYVLLSGKHHWKKTEFYNIIVREGDYYIICMVR